MQKYQRVSRKITKSMMTLWALGFIEYHVDSSNGVMYRATTDTLRYRLCRKVVDLVIMINDVQSNKTLCRNLPEFVNPSVLRLFTAADVNKLKAV